MDGTNLYDDETFFKGYLALREKSYSANEVEELPALLSLLPSLTGKTVLDLGCGCGDTCYRYAAMGARQVVGIDISEKMLQLAKARKKNESIAFYQMKMEDISQIKERFDVVTSSLAFHYIQDFSKLIKDIHSLLSNEGVLIFSQEHPLTTAPKKGCTWIYKDSQIQGYQVSDYMEGGERNVEWMNTAVTKYHRNFSEIFHSLIVNGFEILEVLEPLAGEENKAFYPLYEKTLHKPNFLVVKVLKR
ncbi:class I SAM-dependent methyltransferase [uncultured Sphaerochaeta sp.]|uniref:class I SAM-dependent methyltransferase n=1 Tax=uncultured Sphaerochaeta sp. TaxID=886478 RepID=UPI002A0A7DE8|nr:class I SAM-dependent methyltransferase [uncultured Sphaerochaeta sp.]